MVYQSKSPKPVALGGQAGLGILREAPDGARTLCLAGTGTSSKGEERLGDVIPAGPHVNDLLEDAIAPLVARFATLAFTEQPQLIEPFLEELRWAALEHGVDHVVLPLWPESSLMDKIHFAAISMGLPADFILTQDETTWPQASLLRNSVHHKWERAV